MLKKINTRLVYRTYIYECDIAAFKCGFITGLFGLGVGAIKLEIQFTVRLLKYRNVLVQIYIWLFFLGAETIKITD